MRALRRDHRSYIVYKEALLLLRHISSSISYKPYKPYFLSYSSSSVLLQVRLRDQLNLLLLIHSYSRVQLRVQRKLRSNLRPVANCCRKSCLSDLCQVRTSLNEDLWVEGREGRNGKFGGSRERVGGDCKLPVDD